MKSQKHLANKYDEDTQYQATSTNTRNQNICEALNSEINYSKQDWINQN